MIFIFLIVVDFSSPEFHASLAGSIMLSSDLKVLNTEFFLMVQLLTHSSPLRHKPVYDVIRVT